jgi:hypothetical protein
MIKINTMSNTLLEITTGKNTIFCTKDCWEDIKEACKQLEKIENFLIFGKTIMINYKFYYIDTYYYSARPNVPVLIMNIEAPSVNIAREIFYSKINFDKFNCIILKIEENA